MKRVVYEGFFVTPNRVQSFGLFHHLDQLTRYAGAQRKLEPEDRDADVRDVCMGEVFSRSLEVEFTMPWFENRLVGPGECLHGPTTRYYNEAENTVEWKCDKCGEVVDTLKKHNESRFADTIEANEAVRKARLEAAIIVLEALSEETTLEPQAGYVAEVLSMLKAQQDPDKKDDPDTDGLKRSLAHQNACAAAEVELGGDGNAWVEGEPVTLNLIKTMREVVQKADVSTPSMFMLPDGEGGVLHLDPANEESWDKVCPKFRQALAERLSDDDGVNDMAREIMDSHKLKCQKCGQERVWVEAWREGSGDPHCPACGHNYEELTEEEKQLKPVDLSPSAHLAPDPPVDESMRMCPRPQRRSSGENLAGIRSRVHEAFEKMDAAYPSGFGYALVESFGHPTHELHLRFINEVGTMSNTSFHLRRDQVDDTVGRLRNLITFLECYRDGE